MNENRLRVFCILVLLVFMHSFLQAAPTGKGKIEGHVFDSKTNEPLPGANVFLQGTTYGAISDLDGKFAVLQVPVGDYKLVVRYMGYQERTTDVTVEENQTINKIIKLDFKNIEGEVVVITAQAEGQIAAINQQIRSNTITNIVSQNRIQELPDVNAAESIGRLPGVSIQRSGGEATKIAIRGLSPKYNTVSVNGVRVPATGGDDRSVDLSLISSNMLAGIEVKKAVTPDMDADAIGGTVDLKIREAPDNFKFDFLSQGGYNQLQNYYGNYKFAGSMSDRFFTSRLGFIASFNTDDYDRSADKFSSNYRQSTISQTSVPVIAVTEVGLREETVKRGRTGGSFVFDYRIPDGKITMNTFYNRLRSDGLYRINNINSDYKRHYYDMERRKGTTSIFTGAFGVEQDFKWFHYDIGVARTASRTNNPEDFVWRFGQEGDVFKDLPNENTLPSEIPSMVKIDSLAALHNIWVYKTKRAENVTTSQLNIQVPLRLGNWITGYIKTGGKLQWLNRRNDEEQNGRAGLQYGSGAGNLNTPFDQIVTELPDWHLDDPNNGIGYYGVLPISLVQDNHTRSNFLDGKYDIGFTYKEAQMMQLTRALQRTQASYGDDSEYRNNAIGSRGRDYDGIERYQAAYIMAELNMGNRITLIPGVRWEADYSKYHGQRYREIITAWQDQYPSDLVFLENTRDNAFWLPMVHLQVKPSEWMKVRLARTETLTRPDYIQYAPITTIDGFKSYVRAANALLKPALSANYDAAISIYQNKVGLFSIAGFYKSIKDLILYVNFPLHPDITPLLPSGTNVPESWYVKDRPSIGTYINNPFKATYKGFEVDWQTNFWYLPSIFKGLVLNANYTYIHSETKYQAYYLMNSDSIKTMRPRTYYQTLKTDSIRTGRMPDQPTHIANITIGYDYKGFSARLSYLYQTDRSSYIDPSNPLLDTFSDDYARLDLTLMQKLDYGVELFANFNNLNSRADKNYRGSLTDHPSYIEYYGFTMDVGARYKF